MKLLLDPIFSSILLALVVFPYSVNGQVTVGTGACALTMNTSNGVTVTESGGNCTVTFDYIGSAHQWTIPAGGLNNVTFEIAGAQGAGTSSATRGANFSGTIPSLAAGHVLTIQVGEQPAQGDGGNAYPNGGKNTATTGLKLGGGGATQISFGGSRVVVAGGGGGDAVAPDTYFADANGGNAVGASGGGRGTNSYNCSTGSGASAAFGGTGGSTSVRGSGAGGGGWAGGGGATKTGNTSCDATDSYGGRGGKGSSYIAPGFAVGSTTSDWNNLDGTGYNRFYSGYINSGNGELTFTFSAAPSLTIESTGETGTSGTNWSISGNTLTITGTANIRASVIQDHLTNTGPLEVVDNINNSAVSENEFNSAVSLDIEFVFEKNPAKYECY